jgi:hypothetical protein
LVDFSYAGYRYGEEQPPIVAELERLGPQSGDQTERIQAALDAVAERPLGDDGFRGALVLEAGTYRIDGTLYLNASGVVLRGAGDGSTESSDTILVAPGDTPHQRSVIVMGSGSTSIWSGEAPGTRTDIVTPHVRAGARELDVADASAFAADDNVIIRHPSTSEWISAKDGGGVVSTAPWSAGQIDMWFNRRIVGIQGSTLTLDVPVYDHLIRDLAQSYLYENTRNNLVTQVGLEDLRVDIQSAGGSDENHAWNAIDIVGVEDAWVRRATLLHFGYAGVRMREALRVTIDGVSALDPVAERTGGRMYNFSADARTQLVLIKNSHARGGRHNFVSNGTSSVSGIVVYRSISDSASTSSEGHRRWSQAMLFDNISEQNSTNTRVVGLYNRGDWGTSHGWAVVHSALWNYDVGDGHAVIQKPPGGQNYSVGGAGSHRGEGPFPGPAGFIERQDGTLFPESLYEAQLCERLR